VQSPTEISQSYIERYALGNVMMKFGDSDNFQWEPSENICEWQGITCDDDDMVVELKLNNVNLQGKIATEIGLLTHLEKVYLSWNQLSGTIPSELGNLKQLKDVYLHTNSLTGPIPSEIGVLENLEDLWLHENNLTGIVDPSICDLKITLFSVSCGKVKCKCCNNFCS